MSFLSRRRSLRQPRPSLSPSPSPSPQPSSHGSALDLSTASLNAPPPSVRKRFSTLAARLTLPMRPNGRPKALSNISHITPRSPSRSPSPLSPDIRRPSGLGRRASSLSGDEGASSPKAPSPAFALHIESPRERCLSSPDLLNRVAAPPPAPVERGRSMRIRRKPLPPLEPTSPPPTSPLPPPPPTPPTEETMHDADAQMITNGFHFPPSPAPSTHGSHIPPSPSAETLPPHAVAFPSYSPPAPPTPPPSEPRPKTAPTQPVQPPQPSIPLPRPARARSRPFPVPLGLLVPYLSRADLTRLARVSRRFRAAASAALYRDLDLSPRAFATPPPRWSVLTTTSSESNPDASSSTSAAADDSDSEDEFGRPTEKWQRAVDACVTRLASTPALGKLVHAFACPLYPSAPPHRSNSPSPSFAFALRLALGNMPHLAALVLPAPPPDLDLDPARAPFALQRLVLTARCRWPDVRAFVREQRAVREFEVPRLVETDDIETDGNQNDNDNDNGGVGVGGVLLPDLTTLAGPPALVAALAPRRPLHTATLHITQTLYDGLRPAPAAAALAQSAARVTRVRIVAAPGVDARSLAKVGMALGRELGEDVERVELACALGDEVLYKQLASLLPRFRALRTLRLSRTRTRTRAASTSTSPSPHSHSHSHSHSHAKSDSGAGSPTTAKRAPVLPPHAPLDSPSSPPLSALLAPSAPDAFVTPPTSPWIAFPASPLRSEYGDGDGGGGGESEKWKKEREEEEEREREKEREREREREKERERDPAEVVRGWARACPKLVEVVLPGGARWARDGAEGELVRVA